MKMSMEELEILGGKLAVCGLVYFLSIEVAFQMLDPKASPLTRTLYDIVRQAVTLVAAILYVSQQVNTRRNVGIWCCTNGSVTTILGSNNNVQHFH